MTTTLSYVSDEPGPLASIARAVLFAAVFGSSACAVCPDEECDDAVRVQLSRGLGSSGVYEVHAVLGDVEVAVQCDLADRDNPPPRMNGVTISCAPTSIVFIGADTDSVALTLIAMDTGQILFDGDVAVSVADVYSTGAGCSSCTTWEGEAELAAAQDG